MQLPEIAFIGAGNMGRALIGGLARNGSDPARIRVADPSEQQLDSAQAEFGVRTRASSAAAAEDAEVVIVAVKPQAVRDSLSELAAVVARRRPLLISVAAGVRIDALTQWLGGHARIVRTMP